MKRRWPQGGALVFLLTATRGAFGLERLPMPPAAEAAPPIPLPRLTEPFTPDGVLQEWAQAACVPVRSPGCIAHRSSAHEWRGPADAGMEWYGAWNPEGLCLAAVVADDEVRNDRPEDALWQQDCVELFLDGRSGDRFLKSPYSPSVYQLLIRPPLPPKGAVAVPAKPDQKAENLRLGARRTAFGYTVELLVPWTNFPEIRPQPGTQVGLQAGVDDSDVRDGEELQPLLMTINGTSRLAQDPAGFLRWELVEAHAWSEETPLGPQVQVEWPRIVVGDKLPSLRLTAGGWLASRGRQLEIFLQDSTGTRIWQTWLRPRRMASPWLRSWQAQTALPPQLLRAGGYTLTVRVQDRTGRIGGQTGLGFYVLGNGLEQIYQALRQVDVAALASHDPFKAAAYCGVGAAVERFKRAVEMGNLQEAVWTQHEVVARLELLEQGDLLVDPAEGWLELLRLGAEPTAQVVVEYKGGYQQAGVTFCWGALPLVAVQVSRYKNSEAAAQALETSMVHPGLVIPLEKTTLAGYPATVTSAISYEIPCDPREFVPEKQGILHWRGRNQLGVVDLSALEELQPTAVTILDSCPEAVRQKVAAWATARNLTLTDLATAFKSEVALVVGDPRGPETADSFEAFKRWNRLQRCGFMAVSVLSGQQVLQAIHPSRRVCEEALALVLAGKAVTQEQVDRVRHTLLAWSGAPLPKEGLPASAGEPLDLFCGDTHMHTFYSDGATSPVALLLEALYANLDYAVITDHNTLSGALLATRLMAQHRCAFPLTVGEEITASYAHMCAYPLQKLVAWDLPAYDIVKAAHAQGAVIQWNHPGFPGSPWDTAQQPKGLVGTAFDAWEHYTPWYEEWKAKGVVPVFVGSTDTHDGTFSWPERTVIQGPSAQGDDLAEAIRAGNVAMWCMEGDQLLYGREEIVEAIWAALAEGRKLKEEKVDRLRAALRRMKLVDLLKASEPRMVAEK